MLQKVVLTFDGEDKDLNHSLTNDSTLVEQHFPLGLLCCFYLKLVLKFEFAVEIC